MVCPELGEHEHEFGHESMSELKSEADHLYELFIKIGIRLGRKLSGVRAARVWAFFICCTFSLSRQYLNCGFKLEKLSGRRLLLNYSDRLQNGDSKSYEKSRDDTRILSM